jgi:deoxyribonuclease-1
MRYKRKGILMMKKMCYLFIGGLLLIVQSCGGGTDRISKDGNTRYESFTEVKKILMNEVYKSHRTTFYCGCQFSNAGKVRCKTGKGARATRIEWEHVVPASRFGQTFSSWKSTTSLTCSIPSFIRKLFSIKCEKRNGRENARRESKAYRLMESDMYNLVPAIGFVNQKRSNYPYKIIPGEKREFGNCDFEVSGRAAEPAPHIRGDIARTYFYMNAVYPGRNILSKDEEKEFKAWDKEDPADTWECERCKKIEGLQGNVNMFVKKACQENGLW